MKTKKLPAGVVVYKDNHKYKNECPEDIDIGKAVDNSKKLIDEKKKAAKNKKTDGSNGNISTPPDEKKDK